MRKTRPAYTVVQPTSHWRIVDGVYYRDCIVRMRDGALRLYAIRDDLVSVAA